MRNKTIRYTFLGLLVLVSTACASAQMSDSEQPGALETYNRAMFKFNYQVDKYILKPVAEGYRAVTSKDVRVRVRSALANLREPLSAVNHLLQAEPGSAANSVSRFAINSTLGLAGMFDVAEGFGLKKEWTSFNQTFAKWCIPSGPFIVLPFLGPSSPRATVGWAFEFAFDPVFWATYHDANIRDKVSYSYAALQAVSLREASLDLLDDLERNSVDFYSTMRSAYLQNQKQYRCWRDAGEVETSYDFDFGLEEEDEAFDEMEAE